MVAFLIGLGPPNKAVFAFAFNSQIAFIASLFAKG